jgi:hypothetical protein
MLVSGLDDVMHERGREHAGPGPDTLEAALLGLERLGLQDQHDAAAFGMAVVDLDPVERLEVCNALAETRRMDSDEDS